MNLNQCYIGDCTEGMRAMKADGHQVQTIITSPPYFGLRDYGREGQIGLEETPREYVARLVEIFREAWDLLADNGTVWLNLGDSYASGGRGGGGSYMKERKGGAWSGKSKASGWRSPPEGLKDKDLIGIPWRVAFALQDDGWYLRQDIIWRKPNPMPESVQDRCTKAHEYIFLLTKGEKYYYDHEAIKEPAQEWHGRAGTFDRDGNAVSEHVLPGQNAAQHRPRPSAKRGDFNGKTEALSTEDRNAFRMVTPRRNKRSVWDVPLRPYAGAHFAVFPEELIEPCILAGSAPGDVVFDPFMGSGTTASVAQRLGRNWLGCELNPEYAELQRERTLQPGMPLIGGGA